MNSHEDYCSLETCKLLKKAGFDWGCQSAWDLTFPDEPYLNYDAIYPVDFRNNLDDVFYAPTLSVAQKWLREVKGMVISVLADRDSVSQFFKVKVLEDDGTNYKCWYIWENDTYQFHKIYKTYEEAQEAGIKKCLEIILEKDE